jgi:peptide/nickel transport system substrate-binding protein
MKPRAASLVIAGLVLGLAASACTGGGGDGSPTSRPGGTAVQPTSPTGFNAAVAGVVNPSTAAGGTLRLASGSDCDSWDPARSYFRWCWTIQRLYVRQLMALAPGPSGGVVPDLATGPGVPNPVRTVWTYTIRDGVRFEDGSPVTTADIKYGIERMWALDVINGGPSQYLICLLDRSGCDLRDYPDYRGPYRDPRGGLDSVQVPNDTTIVFRLARPYADFDYLMALPATAPVPRAKDIGENYTRHPVASGPFKFGTYDTDRGLTLVRNPQWDQRTDPIRRPLVDRIELRFYVDQRVIDRRLSAGDVDLLVSGGVSDEIRRRILADEGLKRYADNPFTGVVRYLALRPSTEPLDDIHCRRAIFYAVDKAMLQAARGGPSIGQLTGSMTPLGLPGADPGFDPYPVGPDWSGDLDQARSELATCGHPRGFTVSAGALGSPDLEVAFVPLQRALARIGVQITLDSSCEIYNCTRPCWTLLPDPGSKEGLSLCGWDASIPTTASFWTEILQSGSAYPADPRADTTNAALGAAVDRSLTVPADQRAQAGHEVDRMVMDDALLVPYLLDKVVYYRNPRLTNVQLDPYAQYDLVNLGVGGA